jgi:phosphoserine aminotransferase
VIGEAEANLRSLLAIPDAYHVVFCQGGASMEFSTSSAMAFSGFDCDNAMIVIAFQSLPMRSLPR